MPRRPYHYGLGWTTRVCIYCTEVFHPRHPAQTACRHCQYRARRDYAARYRARRRASRA